MKIVHDENGVILAVTVDSETPTGSILTVADNEDYMTYPEKYRVENGAVVQKPYIAISHNYTNIGEDGIPIATKDENGKVAVTLTAHNPDGSINSALNEVVTLKSAMIITPPFTLETKTGSLVNGSVNENVLVATGRIYIAVTLQGHFSAPCFLTVV